MIFVAVDRLNTVWQQFFHKLYASMRYPNRSWEKKLHKRGFQRIAGIDEAGRGAWAGPLVAAAVILDLAVRIKGLRDSKLLRSPDRKRIYDEIMAHAVAVGVGVVTHDEIDRLGLQPANRLAMSRAVADLAQPPDYVLVDGLDVPELTVTSQAIVDGDHKVASIAAASIVAKVTRDAMMDELDERYAAYGFKQHKGYGTDHHHHMLMRYGVSDIHRKTYEPIKFLLEIDERKKDES